MAPRCSTTSTPSPAIRCTAACTRGIRCLQLPAATSRVWGCSAAVSEEDDAVAIVFCDPRVRCSRYGDRRTASDGQHVFGGPREEISAHRARRRETSVISVPLVVGPDLLPLASAPFFGGPPR
eukprot:CAMPEP_0194312952 /NCGR_PEP_ID=MMETSP0171-20130528/9850_1 /TAXON_ID=218684 /ORGANISM="Corethron pennatum, Strain L29A3" /LENGTH=122 /DNA_ID=CAMNT_0039067685 /DNA_START=173 /DNA_END=537 /DNA_ORIENTATION=-